MVSCFGVFISIFWILWPNNVLGDLDSQRKFLLTEACARRPNQSFCNSVQSTVNNSTVEVTEDDDPIPIPIVPTPNVSHRGKEEKNDTEEAKNEPKRAEGFIPQRDIASVVDNEWTTTPPSAEVLKPFRSDYENFDRGSDKLSRLRERCMEGYSYANKLCVSTGNVPPDVFEQCRSYADDCLPYLPSNDFWKTLKSLYSSVDVGYGIGFSGIPYYPINEEGAIGVHRGFSVPFGAFGGGYSSSLGVRDYWSQYKEAGANWIDGIYGYRSGWSVPLVQSLGVEGHRGTRVAVPLDQRNFGKIGVDTGLGVGGYYAQNDHTGVDWREGNVNHQFGVGVPFAGVGVNTGTSVSFPSLNTWLRALTP